MPKIKITKQILIIIIILLVATAITTLFILFKPEPKKEAVEPLAPLVEVMQLKREDHPMVVTGYGTAAAKVEVEIAPQVSGKIVSVNPQFKAGGFIKADEEILSIDPRDYKLAVRQAKATVADAKVKLELEKSEAAVALQEWKQIHPGTEPDSPLVLREPQIKQAEALVESAQATLATAQLNLERTSIVLPIDVKILSETVDLGQFVTTGQRIGNAYGIDTIEIEVPMEDKDLEWFDIPDALNGNSKGSKALAKADFAGKENIWQGFVKRTTGRIDPRSRLINIVIEVSDPFETTPVLLPGIFTEVQIQGKTLEDSFAIPRNAIHNKNEVWVMNDKKLHIKELNIVRADEDFIYVKEKLNDGDFIITSSLDAVVDGMAVRIKEKNKETQENEKE